ncbi:assimilatory nitrate reductase NasA [Halocatena halophila]|uniref:assimilatory nitrate reductase NasA n=1 Tax=Halocatena halophila TaxID=2814576 RepID=UPI002ED3717B
MSRWVQTTCMRCAVGCGHLQRGVDAGYGLDVVRGDAQHPTNRGLACRRGVRETASPAGTWLSRPLVRKDGELVPTTWDVALTRVGDRFRATLERSPDAIGVLGSGQQTNEAAYALGKFARGVLGTRYYDANTTLCMASAVGAYYRAFGSDAPPPTYDDVPKATTHVVWGANPAAAHPVLFRWIRESADEGTLCVVDPVTTETAEAADCHIALTPGGDLALARAVLAFLDSTDRIDRSFVGAATSGLSTLLDDLPALETAAKAAGVDPETVARLGRLLDDRTIVYWGMGINQSVRGTLSAHALIDLCLATGNMGPGSGPFSLTGQANSMGTRVCSSKGTWPGHRSFEKLPARRTVADHWDVPLERLPTDSGPGPVGVVEAIETGPVEALYCVATNPVAGLPDADTVRERLDDAFVVVQDAFHTATTEYADVVLPATTWGESDGTAMNMERTVSRVRPATETPSGVRSDLAIIDAIATQLGGPLFETQSGTPTPDAVFEEFTALTADTPADCSGISYERLDRELAVRWPAPTKTTAGGYRYYDDGSWSFATADGRARFSSTAFGDTLPEPSDETYPLVLTTARESDRYNTGVRSGPTDIVEGRINPVTADHSPEDVLTIDSRRGAIRARLRFDSSIPEGMVWLPIHHPDTNRLTIPETDPDSDEPNYKQCAVRLQLSEDATAQSTEPSEANA